MVTWERELAYLLERENTILEELFECSVEKTNMLAKGKVDEISKMMEKEQPLSLHLQTMETKRIALLKRYHIDAKTLRESCKDSDAEYKDVLETQLQALRAIAEKLKERNDFNNELTKSRLEFYGKVRSMITKPVYGYDRVAGKVSRSSIDRTI
jgi:flagellar biosynthesis/type III secretory pathway chaperone